MSKMIVYICVIWISATENNEGLTRCMWHESQVAYQNISECQDDLIHSMELLRLRIRQEFGGVPEKIFIEPKCVLRS
jgi:hypothetical protein